MSFAYLFLDREFPDFNFSATWDPDLRPGGGPSQLKLIQMVHGARRGERGAAAGFTETMYWTLRPESFECFQRVHGPRSISYRDWFFSKLAQFLDILVYEQLSVVGPGGETGLKAGAPWEEGFLVLGPGEVAVDPSDLEKTYVPADNNPTFWGEIVDEVCHAGGDRLAVLEEIMGRLRRRRGRVTSGESATGLPAGVRPRREWGRTKERNRIIRELIADDKGGREICVALDEGEEDVLPIMQRRGITTWLAGWADEEVRRNIQQLFSKQRPKP